MKEELSYQEITAAGHEPERYILLLHGILGRGNNLRTLARKVCESRPSWGVILVDLRGHGHSPPMEAPHTVQTAAEDLLVLQKKLESESRHVRAVAGHSFGGKVALSFASEQESNDGDFQSLVILDSSMGPVPEQARVATGVLETLETLHFPFPSTAEFKSELTSKGISQPVASWLASNLVHGDDGYSFAPSLEVIRALLCDYTEQDLWPKLDTLHSDMRVTFVHGGRSTAVSPENIEQTVAYVSQRDAAKICTVPNAGHWIHVEALQEVVAAIVDTLPPA